MSEPRAFCVNVQNSYANFAEWYDRVRRYAIRLASRSELSGCSVDGAGLLFLPAAGLRAEKVRFDLGNRYGTIVSNSITHGRVLTFNGWISPYTLDVARSSASAIRLASRQGCLVVRFGIGLLFLPAAYGYTRWQSVVSKNAAATGGINVWGVLFGNKASEPGNHTMVACQRAFVRLASRLGLSVVMSVVFSLLFLPVAGYRIGLSHDASQGRYWSSVTASNNGESMRAPAAYFTKAQFNTEAIFPRHSLLAIRLASRENCQL